LDELYYRAVSRRTNWLFGLGPVLVSGGTLAVAFTKALRAVTLSLILPFAVHFLTLGTVLVLSSTTVTGHIIAAVAGLWVWNKSKDKQGLAVKAHRPQASNLWDSKALPAK